MGTIVNILLAKSYKYWFEELNKPILHWKTLVYIKRDFSFLRCQKINEVHWAQTTTKFALPEMNSLASSTFLTIHVIIFPGSRVIHKNIGILKRGMGAEKSLHNKWV